MTLASNELVFINFYTDWCRFSNLSTPMFDEAADKVSQIFPEAGKVVMAKVDCDIESSIATRFYVKKYPTFKVIRNGQLAKMEYRGRRSVKAFESFVKKELKDPIKKFHGLRELTTLDINKRIIIGYFDSKDQPDYNIFRRVAMNLMNECQFYVGFGEASKQMHRPGQPIIVFRPDLKRSNDLGETFEGDMSNFDALHVWASENCVPVVRKITFENADTINEL